MDPLSIDALAGSRPHHPLARLGRAAMLLTRELADCRREIAELRRENADLRRKLRSHRSDRER
jgi:hypothetical protein